MNLADVSSLDMAGMLVGFLFTLFVASYIFGDNALFRIAIHIFIGVSAGFVAVMAWYYVIWPQIILPLFTGDPTARLLAIVPLALSVLLFFKAVPRLSAIGTPVVAYLVGVGAATAVGGAVLGTVFPQVGAAIDVFNWQAASQTGSGFASLLGQFFMGGIFLLGTLTTLAYFHFGVRSKPGLPAKKPLWMEIVSAVGQGFIAVTFGAIFAGVYAAALTALVERINFIVNFILSFVTSLS
jgi:hypothetical protein